MKCSIKYAGFLFDLIYVIRTHFSFIMHAKPTRTFFWFPEFYFSRKIFKSDSISYFERNRVPNLGPKVSNRIFVMIDRVAKRHFKFKRKLRLPKLKFKQGIKKIFSGCLIKRFVYFNQHTLDILLMDSK